MVRKNASGDKPTRAKSAKPTGSGDKPAVPPDAGSGDQLPQDTRSFGEVLRDFVVGPPDQAFVAAADGTVTAPPPPKARPKARPKASPPLKSGSTKKPPPPPLKAPAGTPGDDRANPAKGLVLRGSEIDEKTIEWLWLHWLAMGFVTVIAAKTGCDKLFIILDVLARLTAKKELPDGNTCLREPANVLIISRQSHNMLLQPTLKSLGADMGKILIIDPAACEWFRLSNERHLDMIYKASGNPHIIFIDRYADFYDDFNENSNAQVRPALNKLVAWMRSRKEAPAIWIGAEMNKDSNEIDVINRFTGSAANTLIPSIGVCISPGEEEALVVQCLKPLKPHLKPTSLGSLINDDGIVEWLGEVEDPAPKDTGGTLNDIDDMDAVEKARRFFFEIFLKQDEWTHVTVLDMAHANGVSKSAMQRYRATKQGKEFIKSTRKVLYVNKFSAEYHKALGDLGKTFKCYEPPGNEMGA